jgi:pimeloyl-ACP methyl ester carboxylesterase
MNTTRAPLAVLVSFIALVGCRESAAPTAVPTASIVSMSDDDARDGSGNVMTIDHQVPHVSTLVANGGELVHLFVRERVRADVSERPREAVLMIHGRSIPVLAAAELRHGDYDWASWLARSAGVDVFMLDFQGHGRSPRPKMDDPCNVPTAQQGILIPNPLSSTCPHSYPFTLNTSGTDLDELDTVIEYIRALRGVERVHLIGWSAGAFRVGPYAARHPDKVASLLFFAAIFNTGFRGPPPIADPTPMVLSTRADAFDGWNAEASAALANGCQDPREPGIQDVVWAAIMENDQLGRTWGPPPAGAPAGSPPEGVMRVRQAVNQPLVWNAEVAARITAPTLIVRGEFDAGGGGLQHMSELYRLIDNDNKLRFTVQCAGHTMQWETQRSVLHQLSKEWLKHGRVGGFDRGEFVVDVAGNFIPE